MQTDRVGVMSAVFYSESPIGQRCVQHGFMNEEQVHTILSIQLNHNKFFGELSVDFGMVSADNLLLVLSEIFNVPIVNLDQIIIGFETLSCLLYEEAKAYHCVAFYKDKTKIKIAISDPGKLDVLDKLRYKFSELDVEFYIALPQQIDRFLAIMSRTKLNDLDAVNLLNSILFLAIEKGASDLHFEPKKNFVLAKIRIDGILEVAQKIEIGNWFALRSRIKIIADLNITETRKPQSGHTHIDVCSNEVDLRISTHPGVFGENIAIRILNVTNGLKKISQLNFEKQDLKFLKDVIKNPSGIFLIVGPTGSGKTTTLYSLLQEMDNEKLNIMTLEDPIEYQIEGIRQLDLNDENLLSFSDGVRSILRQDPDVLLVGEIRDEKTASAVLRASLTGRLVLATLHASTPVDALRRLENLNVNIKEFSNQILGIFSQRLVRKIEFHMNKKFYKGRLPVCEWLRFSKDVKTKIFNNNLDAIKPDRTFRESIESLIRTKKTDQEEIERIFGKYGDI